MPALPKSTSNPPSRRDSAREYMPPQEPFDYIAYKAQCEPPPVGGPTLLTCLRHPFVIGCALLLYLGVHHAWVLHRLSLEWHKAPVWAGAWIGLFALACVGLARSGVRFVAMLRRA